MSDLTLLLVGCGKMGGALLRKALKIASRIYVVEPHARPEEKDRTPSSVTWLQTSEQLPSDFLPDIVILAFKPQQMEATLPAYGRFTNAVFLSIAAGTTLKRLQKLLGAHPFALIRSMPNLPACIGEGMTVAVANEFVSGEQKNLADQFLKTVGLVTWTADEAQLDAVTAVSGSGPAYVFALCEAMARAGEALGLPPDVAAGLARQTIIGSGALLADSPDMAETLRKNVTSPGGTTEAALKHLLADDGLPSLMLKAMRAAAERSKELAN